MTRMKRLASTVGFVAAAALGGCVAYAGPAGVTYVSSEPPVARAEVITTSPGVGFVWVNGHWGWDGSYYRWVSGGWTRPAVGYTTWVSGRWVSGGRGWYYRDGYWR